MSGLASIARIVLEVTRRCPRQCPFCYLEASSAEPRGATFEGPPAELPASELAALTVMLALGHGL